MQFEYILEIGKILIPALISIFVVFIARHFEQRKEAENAIRDKKILIYENFVSSSMKFFFKNIKANAKEKIKLQDDLMKALEVFNTKLLFWGSDKIIKEYNEYKANAGKGDGAASMLAYEKFAYALRKDIGHENKNLKEYDLLKLLIKADEFDEKGNIKKPQDNG